MVCNGLIYDHFIALNDSSYIIQLAFFWANLANIWPKTGQNEKGIWPQTVNNIWQPWMAARDASRE